MSEKHLIDLCAFSSLRYKGSLIYVWNLCTSKKPAAFVPARLWSPETAWKRVDLSLLLSWSLDVQRLPCHYSGCSALLCWCFFSRMCQFREQRNSAKWGQMSPVCSIINVGKKFHKSPTHSNTTRWLIWNCHVGVSLTSSNSMSTSLIHI